MSDSEAHISAEASARERKASARGRILKRVRSAMETGPRARMESPAPHPGPFTTPEGDDPVAAFEARFVGNGGEVVQLAQDDLQDWLETFKREAKVASAVKGARTLVEPTTQQTEDLDAADADLGIVTATWAIAETGTMALDSRGGRRVQLLPQILVVLVPRDRVVTRLAETFAHLLADLPAAVGLHSGPSKSADIGRTTVTGVHGPGRIVAVVLG